jgi:hypothetical protein
MTDTIFDQLAIGHEKVEADLTILQRFALKPKPRKILKALLRNAFKIFLVVRLIGNCCKTVNLKRWRQS